MELRSLHTFQPLAKAAEAKARPSVGVPAPALPAAPALPGETFVASTAAPALPPATPPAPPEAPAAPAAVASPTLLSWEQSGVSFSSQAPNGPVVSLQETPAAPVASGLTLSEMLASMAKPSAAAAMSERESGYLQVFPFKNDEAALKTRAALNARYNDPTTSAESATRTVNAFAAERGISVNQAPEGLTGSLNGTSLDSVKSAAQGVVDKLFLSREASFNPEKHATVSEQTNRFLDLALQAAPKDFSAADAYKLVAGNLALVAYQDKAAAENMLGDHGVRHLLGHNIKACEQLADGLEKQGVSVPAVDRLVMHQAMIVHDLGYAMDSVRDPINQEGLKGQDAGHNVLAARYLRERAQNPDDPLAKLFGSDDLERMHRCVLFHDKDANGGPGVHFAMTATPSAEERASNLEAMTRVADNSHAFEDKLPELLYRKPQSLKAMRLMKTAGELGDGALVDTLKGELADLVKADSSLARDDQEALLQSVSSVNAKSYQFSVGRIAGGKPSFDIDEHGKVQLSVSESGTHQETSALFGMDKFKQMEKFIKDCSGQKVSLSGQCERIEGDDVCVIVNGPSVPESDAFNTDLHKDLLGDRAFVKFALLDSQLSRWQSTLEANQKLGTQGLEGELAEIKAKRRSMLDDYRAGASA